MKGGFIQKEIKELLIKISFVKKEIEQSIDFDQHQDLVVLIETLKFLVKSLNDKYLILLKTNINKASVFSNRIIFEVKNIRELLDTSQKYLNNRTDYFANEKNIIKYWN